MSRCTPCAPRRQSFFEELQGKARQREKEEHKRRKRAKEELGSSFRHDRHILADTPWEEVAAAYKDSSTFKLVGGCTWGYPLWLAAVDGCCGCDDAR